MCTKLIHSFQRFGLLIIAFTAPVIGWAQAPEMPLVQNNHSPYRDPVFYGLCLVALVLLIFIIQLQRVFSGVAKNLSKKNKDDSHSSMFRSILAIIGLGLVSTSVNAQSVINALSTKKVEQSPFLHHMFGTNAFNALFVLIVVELAVVLYYARLIRLLLEKNTTEKEFKAHVSLEPTKPSFWERFHKSVAIEKEEAIVTDHDYDGIRELDNALPPWWKYGFYLTIVWAVFYLSYFHIAKAGPLQIGEYNNQIAEAETAMAAYRSQSANQVDETNVILLTDAAELAKGKDIFLNLCVACHGPNGEGKVGPNLTDAYWMHGGDIKNLFKTVKYGLSGTGMKSWKSDISPLQMAEVTSYILSLQGTNPAGAKETEGTLYAPVIETPSESTDAPIVPIDSIAKPNSDAHGSM